MPCFCDMKVERNDEKVQCDICKEIFHANCIGYNKNDFEFLQNSKQSFKCSLCLAARRTTTLQQQTNINETDSGNASQSSTNNNEHQQHSILENNKEKQNQQHRNLNEQQNHNKLTSGQENKKKRKFADTEMVQNNQISLIEIKDMIENMGYKITNEIKKELNNTITKLKENIEKLTNQVAELTEENKNKETKIISLEQRVNVLEQKALENNITISNMNIPEGEDMCTAVQNLARNINVDLTSNDIVDIYNERKKNNIVLKLSTQIKKREIIANAKKKKPTTPSGTKIYVNDQLSYYNKKLLWLSKIAAKENNWKFIWVKGGKIHAKQLENSNIFIINKEEDINNIK